MARICRMAHLLAILAAVGGLLGGQVGCEMDGGGRVTGADGHAGHSH